ncbi:amiloride-sensitive sodium channel subunit delta [Sorex araneus]|uniref:amiloride-sensitive sodium channel subunit delta n=1 Tax=Sorex araneus TaxID=42254 RepID=UPI002433AEC9|nr:amiloride-sensitive sodium channel subunit delta [Sorex araneus]
MEQPASGGGGLQTRPEGLLELHESFGELLAFFCTHATTHGAVRLVCSRQNRLKTACWALLLLGALGALCWQFQLLFQDYWRYPVTATVSLRSERKHFPAVTLCDMNPQRPGRLRAHLQALNEFAQENVFSLYKFNLSRAARRPGPEPHLPLDRRTRLQRLSPLGSPGRVGFRLCNGSGADCFYQAFSSGVAAAREWYQLHHLSVLAQLPGSQRASRTARFVLSCRYNGHDCPARHVHTRHHPAFGSCYTFSGARAPRHPGLAHGVSLVLRAERQPHVPPLAEAGVKVVVHQHDRSPFLEHRGFSVRPGTQTTIAVREDEVHRLGSPYSGCSPGADGAGRTLLYGGAYSQQACLVSCFQQLMVNACGCAYYLHPLPAGAEYCSYPRHPAWGHCFYRLRRDLESHRLPCTAHCPRPCRDSSYTLSTRTSRWPSPKSTAWILAALGEHRPDCMEGTRSTVAQEHCGSGALWSRSTVAQVRVFLQDVGHHAVHEAPVYSVPRLLSAMGSLWGLWFGSSVLSVLELLELLLDALALALLLSCRCLHRTLGSWARGHPSQAENGASQQP